MNKQRVVVVGGRGKSLMSLLARQKLKEHDYDVEQLECEGRFSGEMPTEEQSKMIKMLSDDYKPRRNKSDRKRDRKNRWR